MLCILFCFFNTRCNMFVENWIWSKVIGMGAFWLSVSRGVIGWCLVACLLFAVAEGCRGLQFLKCLCVWIHLVCPKQLFTEYLYRGLNFCLITKLVCSQVLSIPWEMTVRLLSGSFCKRPKEAGLSLTLWMHSRRHHLWTNTWGYIRYWISSHFILDFLACRTTKNKCLVLKPLRPWHFVSLALMSQVLVPCCSFSCNPPVFP